MPDKIHKNNVEQMINNYRNATWEILFPDSDVEKAFVNER
jgi:hypothetical protein